MKITGEKGLGSFLKTFLKICLILGVICGILLPFILLKYNVNLVLSIIVTYPNCFLLALITLNFIKLFDSLKNNNPFCIENVEILKKTGIVAIVQSATWAFDFIVWCILTEKFNIVIAIALIFLFILFFGVSIALFIASELFNKATEYKKENELTI